MFHIAISKYDFNANGLADVRLRLGNIPAEYTVTTKCDGCVPEFATVNFTSCGKLHTDRFSQSGQSWSFDCYANHNCEVDLNATIGRYGCALTTLATLINYYANTYPELNISTTNPGALNDYLRGLTIPQGYNKRNEINFGVVRQYSNGTIKYVGRYDVGNYTQAYLLGQANLELLSGRPVIFRIFRKDNRYHFIVAVGKCGDSYIIADPAGGIERLYNPGETDYIFSGIRIFRP
ncbi:MAG: hypothetical protein AB1637_02505 [Elusimicrobiota bacterium]